MKSGVGHHMVEKGRSTEKRIRDYMKKNPEAFKFEIIRDLGITYPTLRKHLKNIGNY